MKKAAFIFILTIFLAVDAVSAAQVLLLPRGKLSTEYTDNLFLVNDQEEHEWISTVSLGMDLSIQGAIAGLSLSYDPAYVHYERFSEYDTLRHVGRLDFNAALSKRLRFDLFDSYILTEEQISEEDYTTRDERKPYSVNIAEGRLTYQYTADNSIAAGYRYTHRESDDTEIENYNQRTPFAELTHWFTRKLGIELNSSYSESDFETSEDLIDWRSSVKLTRRFSRRFQAYAQYAFLDYRFVDNNGEDYQVHEPAIGITYTPNVKTTADLSVGYYYRDRNESEDRTGFSMQGSLQREFQKGTIDLNVVSGYDDAYFGSERLGFNTYYEVGINSNYDLTRDILVDCNAAYREAEYKDTADGREDKVVRAGCGIRFQILRALSLRLSYSYRTADSTDDDQDYVENRGLAQINIVPVLPFRIK